MKVNRIGRQQVHLVLARLAEVGTPIYLGQLEQGFRDADLATFR